VLFLGFCTDEGWLLLLFAVSATEQSEKTTKHEPQSVSNSETDVTVNLTNFEELLVRQTIEKLSKTGGWTTVKAGDRIMAHEGVGRQETKGVGNLCLKAETSKLSLYCLLFRRQSLAFQSEGSL